MVIEILSKNRQDFINKISSVNKKASALGYEILQIKELSTSLRQITVNGYKVYVEVVSFDLIGSLPEVNGWFFLGVVDHTEVGNIIKTVPGQEIPTIYWYRENYCDHCNSKRERKKTIVLKNKESGKIVQVGRSCIKDFMSNTSIEQMVRAMGVVKESNDVVDGYRYEETDYSQGGMYDVWIDVIEVLATASAFIRTKGWVKKSDESQTVLSTASRVLSQIFPSKNSTIDFLKLNHHDFEVANEIVSQTLENKDSITSSFDHNAYNYISSGKVNASGFPLICSLVAVHHNKSKNNILNEFLGDVKTRIRDTVVVVEKVVHKESPIYGFSTIINFLDEKNRRLVWFASGYKDIQDGERFLLTGTVVNHNEYRNTKQTVVSRCILKEVTS